MDNINELIEFNLNYIKSKVNSRLRRLELKDLNQKMLDTDDCIVLHKILIEKNLLFENEYGDLFLTSFADEIVNNGGWLKFLDQHKAQEDFQKEKSTLEFEKTKIDLELSKKMLKEYPYTKWFARIGFFIAICLAILELIKFMNNK